MTLTRFSALVTRALFVVVVAACGAGDGSNGEESSGGDMEIGECDGERPCEAGETCRSPEQHRWNRCEAPSRVRCESGQVGDDCGNCFGSCLSDADCTDGKRCNGAYCESPRECFEQ